MKLPRQILTLHKRRLIAIIATIGLGLLVAPSVYAQSLGDSIFLILDNILMGMITMFASLTGIFVSLLVVVARYNTFLNAPVVMQGWPIVRDLMNMVFIIGLLMISAGTVLRLQNYRYNRLLGKLIIMALLVNFSKFIAVFLLQFGQVVMLTFVNAFRDVAFGNFSHMFGLDAVLNFARENPEISARQNTGLSVFVTLLAGLIMMLIAFVVMLAITVILFVRIIALWLLIILSPLAYALRVIPQTEQYAGMWWKEFTKYVVVGPVLAFFLWIALALVGNGSCVSPTLDVACTSNPITRTDDTAVKDSFDNAKKDTETLRKDFVTEALSLDRLMTFIVGIIFLMMGLQYAQKSGTAGAAFAGKVAAAGFGAAATLTGLNYLRDRTVAPVQGWIKNRGAARQAAIQDRTQTLEAAGDRMRAAIPVGRGAQRAAAAAAAYERTRTARTGQQLGMKDQADDRLQDTVLNSRNMRDRMAAIQELHSRGGGRLNLADPDMRKAFNDVTQASRTQLGVNAYMPEADRKKVRESALKDSFEHMKPEEVRQVLADKKALASGEELMLAANALEKKTPLRADNQPDVELVKAVRRNLQSLPGRLKEYDVSLMKGNPDMAKALLFDNLSTPAGMAGYKSALQQKQMSTYSMGNMYDRLNDSQRQELMSHLHDISPDADTYHSYIKDMDEDDLDKYAKHIDMTGQATDRRNMVAKETGAWKYAFRDKGVWMTKKDAAGEDVAVAQEFIDKLGGEEISKKITKESLKDENVLKALKKSDNFLWKHWENLRTRDAETREALAEGLENYANTLGDYAQSGMLDLDRDKLKVQLGDEAGEDAYKERAFVAQHLFLANKGEKLPFNINDGTRDGGLALFRRTLLGAKAGEVSSINKVDIYESNKELIQSEIGMNMKVQELGDLLLQNYDVATGSLEQAQEKLNELIKEGGQDVVKFKNRLKSLANNPVTGNYVNIEATGTAGGT